MGLDIKWKKTFCIAYWLMSEKFKIVDQQNFPVGKN